MSELNTADQLIVDRQGDLRSVLTKVILPTLTAEARDHILGTSKGTSAFVRRLRNIDGILEMLPPRQHHVTWRQHMDRFIASPIHTELPISQLIVLGTSASVAYDIMNAWVLALIDASCLRAGLQMVHASFLDDAWLPSSESGRKVFAEELAKGLTVIGSEEAAGFIRQLRQRVQKGRPFPQELEAYMSTLDVICTD